MKNTELSILDLKFDEITDRGVWTQYGTDIMSLEHKNSRIKQELEILDKVSKN